MIRFLTLAAGLALLSPGAHAQHDCSATDSPSADRSMCVEAVAAKAPVLTAPRALPAASRAAACTIGTWQPATPATLARSRPALAYSGSTGLFYLIGGEISGGDRTTSVEAYDPSTDSWSSAGSLLTGVSNIGAATVEGFVYIPSGATPFATVADMQRFDPSTGTTTALTPLPTAVFGAGVAAQDGKVYVFGGNTGSSSATNQIYDIASDTWSAGAPLPVATFYPAAVSDGTFLYAIGGETSNLSTVQRYDPASDSWTLISDLMTARGGPGGFFDGQNVWAVGGGWSQYYASTEYWDGASWQAGPDMSTGVRTMGAAFGDGLALKAAGWNGSYQAVTERLAIDCPSTEPVAVSGTLGYGTCPVPVAALASGRARCFLDVTGTNGLDVAQRYTVFLRLDGPDGSRVAFRGEVKLGPGGTAAQQIKLQTQRSDPDGAYTVTLLAEAGSVAAPSGDAVVLASLPLVKGNAGGLRAVQPLAIFPNPASDATTLAFAITEEGPATLVVYDALGREVARPVDGAVEGVVEARLDASALPAGVYVARLTTAGRTETVRLTVVR